MGLVIRGKEFNGEFDQALLNAIFNELRALPYPNVIPLQDADVKEEDTELCLQREMLHVDLTNPLHSVNTKRYIGTKFVSSCVVACIFSDTDTFLIHVDSTEIHLASELKKFSSTANLKVILIGAGDTSQCSNNNVISILIILHRAAIELDLAIEITEQCILERNAFKPEYSFHYLYDRIIEVGIVLARRYFKEEFDVSRFPFKEKILAFKKEVSQEAIFNTQLTQIIPIVTDLYPRENYPVKDYCDLIFRRQILTAGDFYKAIDGVFSKQGYDLLNSIMIRENGYVAYGLSHFVFELETKKVAIIPVIFSTPNELQRIVRVVSQSCADNNYHYAIDNESNQYFIPKFNLNFVMKCLKVQNEALSYSISAGELFSRLDLEYDLPYTHIYYDFVTTLAQPKSVATFSSLFKPKNQAIDIQRDDFACSSSALEALNRISGKQFSLKIRKYPKFVLDALLTCESADEAQTIKTNLSDKGINAYSLSPTILCVAAINTSVVNKHMAEVIPVLGRRI